MADNKVPMIELHCLNGNCGRKFVIELGIFVESKRRVGCPHCAQYDIYPLEKAKLVK